MTSQQTGREAFSPEAIAAFRREKGNGMTSAVGEYTPPEFWDALDEIERLQAALSARAQQGREVDKPVAWIDEYALQLLERGMPALVAAQRRNACTPLYTAAPKQQDDACPSCHRAWGEHRSGYSASRCKQKPAPKQQAVEVTEQMVANAVDAYAVASGIEPEEADIRAALLAALPGKTEVE